MPPLRPVKPEFEDIPLTPTRKAIAERVLQSAREMPVFHIHAEVDATAVLAARAAAKNELGQEAPSYNDFILKAVATTLRRHPRLNAWFENDVIRVAKQVNLAFAAATPEGVLLPTVFEADRKTLEEIAAESREMIAMARAGRLRASLQAGATFTVSNIGPVGIDAFNAIISPPQVAILAIGSVLEKAAVVDGSLGVRSVASFTLTVDHRAIDGADGAAFLADVKKALEAQTWPPAGTEGPTGEG
ncbi:MAG TPA: 2-oxo acid dehydrogenase subunit E2 [Armatimonadota bacterium]|nr:2-oxo acid dehydrogenase subunit E2 [Armatimonadota bacterium]